VTEQKEPTSSPRDLTPSLVAQLRDGDSTAGVLLDDLYRQNLIRFCLGYLGKQDLAEDIVQDVFYQVLKSPTVPDNFRAWIYKICRNRCLNAQRDRGRKRDDQALPTASRLDAQWTGNLTRLVKQEQQSHLLFLLASLSEEQREVIQLRYGENLTRSEIAEVLEIDEPLVKSRLYEGLVKLRQHSSLMENG